MGVATLATETRGGNTWPEIVGQIRLDQAWGGFHVSGMIVNNHVAYNCGAASATCTELSGAPSDKIGGGVSAGFKFNTPTGVNDALYIQGSYSVGATTNTFANIGQGAAFGLYGSGNSFNGGYVWDSVYNSATGVGQQLTTTYGGSLAFEHGWNNEWRTSVFGGAQKVDYNATANAILCSKFTGAAGSPGSLTAGVGGANISGTGACNFDYRIYGIGSRTYWTPVRDLTIGVEVMWTNHSVGHASGVVYNQAANGFKPAGAYVIKDQDVISGMFSVRRFF